MVLVVDTGAVPAIVAIEVDYIPALGMVAMVAVPIEAADLVAVEADTVTRLNPFYITQVNIQKMDKR